MQGNLSAGLETASKPTSANGSVSEITSASDSDDWFGSLARPILGKEPGVALHYITGFPASSCAKYVAKVESSRRQPPAYFLRALLRSEQGEPFFLAIMDGCEAGWWHSFKRAHDIGAAVNEIVKR